MSNLTLEERVAELERLMATVIQQPGSQTREKNWRRTVGMFKDDPILKELIEEGRRIREEDRRQTR